MKTLLIFWLLATAGIQMGDPAAEPGARFSKIIAQTAAKLQESAARRPFKIKVMNDSLEKLAQALRLAALSRQDPASREAVRQLLREARAVYPENSFALLMQAVMSNSAGQTSEANSAFEQYLLHSRTYTDFDREFITWGDFHALRRLAFELLRARGVRFEGREKEIQVRTPFEQLLHYAMHPAPQDRALNLFFIVFILGGSVLIVLGALSGMVFYRSLGFGVLASYVCIWLAYAAWIYDLAFGLPWGIRRPAAVLFFFCAGILISALEAISSWKEAHRPLAKGFKRCPHCKEVIVSLSVECFKCKKRV